MEVGGFFVADLAEGVEAFLFLDGGLVEDVGAFGGEFVLGNVLGVRDGDEDRFAAAAIYEMVAAGKPRPRAYEVFLSYSVNGQGRYRDYVFYNDQQRVTYVARRRD